MSTPPCRLKLTFVSAATKALAGLLLIASPGEALAVKAEAPTAVCDVAKCETCLEFEAGGRCLKCGIDPQCLGGDTGLSSDFTEMLKY